MITIKRYVNKNLLITSTMMRRNRQDAIRFIRFMLILFFLFPLLIACKEKTVDKNVAHLDTQVKFTRSTFDFGDIAEGEIVTHSFYFKNTGTNNLVIRKIESGCGCTTVDYPQKPIKAGKEEKIEIAFNSSGRNGKQYKEISIFANIPQKKITLKFEANVK